MNNLQFRGRFATEADARKLTDQFERDGLYFEIKRESGKFAVWTQREKPAPIVRANKAVFERKPTAKPVQPKPEPLPKIMLGEVANAGIPPKTAFPKGLAENHIQK